MYLHQTPSKLLLWMIQVLWLTGITNMIMIRDLEHNQCVFCLRCETILESKHIKGDGKSSAKVFVKINSESFHRIVD
jgi:hypothetical protein